LLLQAKKEMRHFTQKINLDCHVPRALSNIWLLPDPYSFLFPPTFNGGFFGFFTTLINLFCPQI
jgi:hypothetical protein